MLLHHHCPYLLFVLVAAKGRSITVVSQLNVLERAFEGCFFENKT